MRVDLCLNPKSFSLAAVQQRIPQLENVLRQYDLQAVYIFGSILKDCSVPMSDLDLAILPPKDLPDWLGFYHQFYTDLCQFFAADNIDVVRLDQAPVSLQARVILSGIPIFRSKTAKQFEDRVLTRYADLAGWRQENWEVTRELVRLGATRAINMIDQNRVERFIFLIRNAVCELHSLNLECIGLEAYLANKHTRALSEHYLRIALEATLDLGRYVIVKTGLGVPQEYRDVGKILREQGILTTQLGAELEVMAGMRNVLVHLYWDIDYPLLYRTIVERVDTFDRLIEQIFNYIEQLEEVGE